MAAPQKVHSSEVIPGDIIVVDGRWTYVARVLHDMDLGSLIEHSWGAGYYDQVFARAGLCDQCGGRTPHATPHCLGTCDACGGLGEVLERGRWVVCRRCNGRPGS